MLEVELDGVEVRKDRWEVGGRDRRVRGDCRRREDGDRMGSVEGDGRKGMEWRTTKEWGKEE